MATIHFSNGVTVNFNGNPTQQDIEQVAQHIQQPQASQQAAKPNVYLSYAKNMLGNDVIGIGTQPTNDLGIGALKGAGSTLKGLGTIGQKVLDQTAGRVVNMVKGNGFTPTGADGTVSDIYRPGTAAAQDAATTLKPSNVTQDIGKGAEQLAEFFLPATKAAQAEDLVNTLTKGISSPLLTSAARVASKGAIQGAAAGGIDVAQTGGNLPHAIATAATAGMARGAFATIGEGAKALKLPERLYSTIFKNTASDMMQELHTETLAGLAEDNPEQYASFVKQGIIKDSGSGPVLNETLAKQALDAGLKGSIRSMAKTVVVGALNSEAEVQKAVSGYAGTVNLGEKQFYNVLKSIQSDYEDVGFGEISDEAGRLASALKFGNGKVSGSDALAVRRLLDRARISSSFDRPASKLSLTQQNLKTLADAARSRLAAIPGLADTMKRYSFYIDAMETLAKEASRRGNNQALSLIDSIFLSNSFGGGNPATGATMAMLRRILMSGPGTTRLAQTLNKSAVTPRTIGATSAAASGLANLAAPRQ